MKILAIDPGALNCGWAILSEGGKEEKKIQYHASGIYGLVREGNYQEYRLLLIEYWVNLFHQLSNVYDPSIVVSEIVPPTGGTIPSVIKRQLSLTVISTVQALAYEHVMDVCQLSASTVKKQIGGSGTASKVKVRNGVLERLPQLEHRKSEWTGKGAKFDEVDAIAIGLTYLGA